jgi:hypothetical protein
MKLRKMLRWAMIPVGAIGGYAYYAYIGCASGACAMASDGFFMTTYGGILGYFIGGIFLPQPKKGPSEPGNTIT